MYSLVKEGRAQIKVPLGKISKDLPVFYNPKMKENRDISLWLLNATQDTKMRMADILAASGVRGIRFALELTKGKVGQIVMNDGNAAAAKLMQQNVKLNKIKKSVVVTNNDAKRFLLESTGFDYIDIDPFGSPNPFLDPAMERISRNGILAITATDTAALAGTAPGACKWKYWATPMHSELMHEIGLRILIRKAQLIGTQYRRALIPLLSYAKDHYMRAFFRCVKSKAKAEKIFEQHHYVHACDQCGKHAVSFYNTLQCDCKHKMKSAGPIWIGALGDGELLQHANTSLLTMLREENTVPGVGFYDLHSLASRWKFGNHKPMANLFEAVRANGYKAARTHFSPTGIKTDMPLEELKLLLS